MPWERLPGITAAPRGSPENRTLPYHFHAAFSSRTEAGSTAGHPSRGCRGAGPALPQGALLTYPVEARLPAELVALGSAEVVVRAEGLVERCYQVEEGLAAALVAQGSLLIAALTFTEPERQNGRVSGVTGTAWANTEYERAVCPGGQEPPGSSRP